MELEKKVFNMIHSGILEAVFTLSSVNQEKEGSLYFLRVVIDSKDGISVEDCVTVSKLINPILDEEDPIEDNYILDVCSKEEGCEANG